MRLDIVLRHSLAFLVHETEIDLGIGDTLVRSLAIPLHCYLEVLRHSLANGVKKPQHLALIEQLKSIPAMNLTKAQLERLRPEDRPLVEQLADKTQQGFERLLEALDEQRYPKARSYIQNLIKPVTTFFNWWLDRGEVIPLNTNAIESAFSQVSNRIKRVGKRWSERGLLN